MVRENVIVVEACRSCGGAFGVDCERSNANRDLCTQCAPQARQLALADKRENGSWLELARDQGIPLWEQQPGESNDEYELWLVYRDLWPDVRPTVTRVARATEVSASTVQRAYNTWTWGARLQAWIREVTAERTAQTRAAKQRMVEDHIAMGEAMRAKAIQAIEAFDPYDVTPNELVAVLKETQRLESTSREMLDDIERATATDVDGYTVDAPEGLFLTEAEATEQAALGGKRGGLDEAGMLQVVDILAQAGVLKGVQLNQQVNLAVNDNL